MNIDLYWFRHPPGQGNFGDELSPWIIRSLVPQATVRWVNPLLADKPFVSRVIRVAKSQIRPSPAGFDTRYSRWHALLRRPSLLAIGSIISRAVRENTSVWGSGIISREDEILAGEFLAVRGPRTQARLRELGLSAPEAMGDPALLVPLVFKPKGVIEAEVTLIPHVCQHAELAAVAPPGVRVLDLTDSVDNVLHAIAGSRVTLSTSLHGLIVSHAFGVPSLWISAREAEGSPLTGDDVKFSDYFSSVGLKQESALEIGRLSELDMADLRKLVEDAFGQTLPSRGVIRERQRDLLLTAPFPQMRRYRV